MLSIGIYSIACFFAALLLTTIYVFCRPLHGREEVKSWRVMIVMFLLCYFGPYGYVEGMTHFFAKPMDKALKQAYYAADLHGDVTAEKLLFTNGHDARALVVGFEEEGWHLTDKPIVAVSLTEEDGKWKPVSYDVLQSDRMNRDSLVFPPYW